MAKIKGKKVLFIRSKSTPIDPRIIRAGITLAKHGYDVHVFLWDRELRYPVEEVAYGCLKVKRYRRYAPYGSLGVLKAMAGWWLAILKEIKRLKPDVIHSCVFDVLPPAIVGKYLTRAKLIHDMFDFLADVLPEKTPDAIRNGVAFAERYLMKHVDGIVLVNEKQREQLAWAKIKDSAIVMNVPMDDIYKKREETGIKGHIPKHGKIILFYGGMITRERGLEYVVRAIEGLKDVKWVVGGYGKDEEFFKQLIKGKNNIEFIGKLTPEELIAWTMKCDIVLGLADFSIPNAKYASPNKLFEAMMCAKPIITNTVRDSLMAKIIKENNCGIIVYYKDVNAIRDAIIRLRDDKLRTEMGMNGRRAFEYHYRWNNMAENLLDMYNRILSE